MKRNGISVVIATIIAAGLLTGCGNGTKESSPSSKSSGGKTPTSANGSVSEEKGGGVNGNTVVPPENLTLLSRLLDYDAEGNLRKEVRHDIKDEGSILNITATEPSKDGRNMNIFMWVAENRDKERLIIKNINTELYNCTIESNVLKYGI